jgi:hypothetical protein
LLHCGHNYGRGLQFKTMSRNRDTFLRD